MVELTELQKAVIKQMSNVECNYLEDVETHTLEEEINNELTKREESEEE